MTTPDARVTSAPRTAGDELLGLIDQYTIGHEDDEGQAHILLHARLAHGYKVVEAEAVRDYREALENLVNCIAEQWQPLWQHEAVTKARALLQREQEER